MRPCLTALILFASLCVSVAGPVDQSSKPARQRSSRHGSKVGSRTSLKHKLNSISGRKERARTELKTTRAEAHTVKQQIDQVDGKLEHARSDLSITDSRLKVAKGHQRTLSAELARDSTDLEKTRRQVAARIRRIYIEGGASRLSTLLGTKSSGEVASRDFLMQAIERKDRELFNHYIELKNRVVKKKLEADREVREVNRLEVAQYAQADSLAEAKKQKAKLLRSLQAKQADLQEMIDQFSRDEAQIARQIQAYEREASSAAHPKHGGYSGRFAGRFMRPVSGPITSTFGMRFHPLLHRVRMHTGVDFGASYGSPIHAAAAGVVIFSGYLSGYGHAVVLDHGGGVSTVYAHASQVFVSQGQTVRQGQSIAAVGASGLATGPHLHFEVRIHGHAVDPLGRL